ncbi:MAG: nuclear transport factor 2 family protein [Dehalococcoidia bacterium]
MDQSRPGDLEAIKQLKARYFRFLDAKEWERFGAVFSDDAVILPPDGDAPVARGRQEIVARVRGVVEGAVTVHHGHMPEIQFTSDTTATGVWSMFDLVDYGDRGWRGYGHYEEEYVKEAGAWKIRSFRLTRLRKDEWGEEQRPGR